MVQKLKILCSAMDSLGHVNAILGFAKILEQRGHQVVMALAPGWKSAIEKHNFEFIPLKLDSTKKEENEIKDENKVSNGSEVKDDNNVMTKVKDESNDSGIVDSKSENEPSIKGPNDKEEKNAEQPNLKSLSLNKKEENEVKGENKVTNGSEVKDDKNKVTVKDENSDSFIVDSKSENGPSMIESDTKGNKDMDKSIQKSLNVDEKEENTVKDENEVKNGSEAKDEENQIDKVEDKSLNDSGIVDTESVSETSITESDTKDKKGNEKTNQAMVGIINSQLAGFRLTPMEFARSSADRIPMWFNWYEKQFAFDDALQEVMDAVKPDMIVIDFMMRLPCLEKSSIPWAQLWSCNPIMLYKDCPPLATGFATDSPKELWKEYRALKDQGDKPIAAYINKWLISRGVRPYAEDEIHHIGESKFLNFYTFPSVLDYNDVAPRPDKWVRMDATVREPDDPTPFVVPEKIAGKPGALIYFSLGTMGCVDLELMNRVISVLAKSPHRFIVSKGPLHEKIELPDNMWGDRYVNQIAILPHVDLVITHGGNNTLTESLYFGKPVIVMPIFWDQLDNAQRVHEKGIGIRIDTYYFQDSDLLDAIEKLLKDEPLKEKLAAISATLKSSKSKEMVCELIEKTVALGKSPFDEEKAKQAQSE